MEQNMLILTDEPFCGCMPEDIRRKLSEAIEESVLAGLLASVSNNVGSLMHETDEDQWAIYALEEWTIIQQILLDRIFAIMVSEGSIQKPPERGWRPVIEPFMERNGYYDGAGWWVKCNPERTSDL